MKNNGIGKYDKLGLSDWNCHAIWEWFIKLQGHADNLFWSEGSATNENKTEAEKEAILMAQDRAIDESGEAWRDANIDHQNKPDHHPKPEAFGQRELINVYCHCKDGYGDSKIMEDRESRGGDISPRKYRWLFEIWLAEMELNF